MTPDVDGRAEAVGRAMPMTPPVVGVRIAGTGCCHPEGKLTNADFTAFMDTSDEWIVQRTGIRERRVSDPKKGETPRMLCATALRRALEDARMDATELDLIVLGSVTGEMTCPSTSCRVAADVGAVNAGAFDVLAACSGFVYSLNIAHSMIRSGTHRTIGVIGCDVMSRIVDYENRAVAILFGDAAGAAILRATDDTSRGMLASAMHADGTRWHDLYLPTTEYDIPEGAERGSARLCSLQMNGREVYKFAVGTFADLIQETLDKAGMSASDVDMYVCHQSNARMLEAARKRFDIPEKKMYVNIDRYGNCSAGSVPLCFDQLRRAGKCRESEIVMFVAFGGGMTWASSLWRL